MFIYDEILVKLKLAQWLNVSFATSSRFYGAINNWVFIFSSKILSATFAYAITSMIDIDDLVFTCKTSTRF